MGRCRLVVLVLTCLAMLEVFSRDDPEMSGTRSGGSGRWEKFACPEWDDVTEVLDGGWDLDRIFFNEDGNIVIFLDVRRYLGTVQEIEVQKRNGLLPSNARLYMPAFDVDVHGGGSDYSSEVDEVWFNGKRIGKLTGDDEIWHLHEFSVPFEEVIFPKAPGSFGRNEIRIKVDVENDRACWCTKIDWVALTFSAPRPVLMVHGLNSDGSTWNEMQRKLSQVLGIPSEVIDVNGHGTIGGNARTIEACLNSSCIYGNLGLKDYYGVKEFNIMAHSKGGLDSRYYVSRRGLKAEDVKYVMQIATPNGGCHLADMFYSKDEEDWTTRQLLNGASLIGLYACDATFDLCPWNMRRFNKTHPLNMALASISVLAGRITDYLGSPGFGDSMKLKAFKYLARLSYDFEDGKTPGTSAERNGDGIVSVASAHRLRNAASGSPLTSPKANHVDIISALAGECIHRFSGPLRKIVRPKYQGQKLTRSGGASRGEAALAGGRAEEEDAAAEGRVARGVRGGEWHREDQSGSGRSISQVIYLQPGERKEYAFPISCRQHLELMLLQAGKDLPVELTLPSGARLTPKTDPQRFTYAEDLDDDGKVQDWFILGLSGRFLLVDLPDAEPGAYRLRLDGSGLKEVRKIYLLTKDKGAVWNLEGRLRAEEIAPGEKFVVEARLLAPDGSVQKGLDYDLKVRLREQKDFYGDGMTVPLLDDGQGDDLAPGDGIFTAALKVDKGTFFDLFLKAKRRVEQFDDSRIVLLKGTRRTCSGRILPGLQEKYLDSNGNHLYDALRIGGKAEVSAPGKYWVEATLKTRDGQPIQADTAEIDGAAAGTYGFELTFKGEKIYDLGKDGPFALEELCLYQDVDGTLLDLDRPDWTYHTKSHEFLRFEHAPLLFLQTGSERNLDADGNGIIDAIEIRMKLLVADGYQGEYVWSGNLLAEDGRLVGNAHASGRLPVSMDPASPASITLSFPCTEIAKGHYRGPFEIQMITMDNRSTGHVQAYPCNYRTQVYSPFDFLKEANVVDVTRQIRMEFSPPQVNRNTGALRTEATLTNISSEEDKPLDLVFRLAMPQGGPCRLCRVDGRSPEGVEYQDVTAQVEKQLLQTGNRDYRFDPGEQVRIRLEIFSEDGKAPDPRLYSFWADPPPSEEEQAEPPKSYFPDSNQDMRIDDWEMLRGMDLWYNLRLDDAGLLRLIRIWKAGGYRFDEARGDFEPAP